MLSENCEGKPLICLSIYLVFLLIRNISNKVTNFIQICIYQLFIYFINVNLIPNFVRNIFNYHHIYQEDDDALLIKIHEYLIGGYNMFQKFPSCKFNN